VRLSARAQTALFGGLIFAMGLAYRATFLSQGFNASDEAFLPAIALRITRGQVIYRDFVYASPPLTPFKEAAVAAILGDGYTFLASRWVFAVEVSLGSVIAFLIIRRFLAPLPAFLVTLPTLFFTSVLYYYSNFNFDAQILFLGSVLILVWANEREPWPLMLAAGGLCGLAFLAKPTYLAMVVGVCALGLLRPWFGGPRRWPVYAAGFAIVVGAVFVAIAAAGLWDDFRHQAFGLLLQARTPSKKQLLFQDWPHWLFQPGHAILAPAALAVLVAAARLRAWLAIAAVVLLGGVFAAIIVPASSSSPFGIPTFGQMNALVSVLAVVMAVNLAASVVTVAARVPGLSKRPWAKRVRDEMFPPSVPSVAVVLEYLHGIDLSSMRFAYVGTFLAVAVALTFLYVGWRLWGGLPAVRFALPAVAGVFIAGAGAVVTHGSPYLDGPRDQMTASLTSARVVGINTLPNNATHISSIISEIEGRSSPGDTIFVFPDGQAYYVITGRTNPTKVDWYDVLATTPDISSQAVADLERNPPTWIIVQDFNESDFLHLYPLDFESTPAWRPIYDYITSHYELVATIDGFRVYRLR
jgi:hypothetical protein